MVIYTSSEGQKIWWGKGLTLGGIIAGVGIVAVGTGVISSCLTDLIEKYQENKISIREAQGLLVYSALGINGLYEGTTAIPRGWKKLQRIRFFEQRQGREIRGDDYPYFYLQ